MHAKSIGVFPLGSFSTIFYPIIVFVISPLVLAVTPGAAVHGRRKELMSEFGDGGFAYRLTPFFLCSSAAAAATGNVL